jgi:hypothetical protein
MFDLIVGTNSSVPHPSAVCDPFTHSFPSQSAQTAAFRAWIWRGAKVELTKLNAPKGQTYLQNADSENMASSAIEATKYAITIKAVSQGLAQRSSHSYNQKIKKRVPIDTHLFRKNPGQRFPAKLSL